MLNTLPVEVRNTLEETLDWFDAAKAERVYTLLDWKWAAADFNGNGTPNYVEIRRMARTLASTAYRNAVDGKSDTHTCRSGGITVRCDLDPLEFSIEFVAVSS